MARRAAAFIVVILIFLLAVNNKKVLKYFYPVDYKTYVEKYSREYKLDPMMVYALIKSESRFNPEAKSRKGAIGLMQITPQTGEYISGLLGDSYFTVERLLKPEINIKYGCFYLSKLYKDFDGNIDLVLAAYNGGEGNVRKWLKEYDDGKGSIRINDVPFEETKNYIIKVKKDYKIYKYIYISK